MSKIKSYNVGIIALLVIVLLIAFTGMVYADSGVNATPEVQGLVTGTSSNVQGTVTETDSGAWTTTYDPPSLGMVDVSAPSLGTLTLSQAEANQILAAGGSITGSSINAVTSFSIPISLLNSQLIDDPPITWQMFLNALILNHFTETNIPGTSGGIHNGVLDPGQVQYTTGYNDQYSGVSGQQTFVKSMAISTANQIATGSNIAAKTNIQFVAIDTGRATRSEDLLLDGAGNTTSTASSILCPFAQSVSAVIPPYCNIVQAGSAFDTTLTSTVTNANDRFVGTDATFPVVLKYNIASKGITLADGTSSPMIGSVSAYLKVHVQEARNQSTITTLDANANPTTVLGNPLKSEDLVYSETSTASGLISGFSKSMSYQSGFNLI